MPAEGFFQRWSRLKTEPAAPLEPVAPPGLDQAPRPVPAAREPEPPAGDGVDAVSDDSAAATQLTLADVAQLDAGSDYSAFVARGVDKSVQRGALKKLFADPHFNTGDGLDLYMGDYNKPDPIPAAMMSALRHSRRFFAAAYPERQAQEDQLQREQLEIASPASQPALTDMEAPMAEAVNAASTANLSEDQA